MSLPVPLAVRLSTSRQDRHVTADLRDLTFRSVVPGGHASATLSLDRPLHLQPDEIAVYGRVVVYDARSAATVWEGRLEDPGRSAGQDGQVWELAAVGPSAHARDRTFSVIYVDRRLAGDSWIKKNGSTDKAAGQASATEDPDTSVECIQTVFPSSATVVNSSRVTAQYKGLIWTGQKLAYIQWQYDSLIASGADWVVRLTTYPSATVAREHTVPGSGGSQPRYIDSDWVNTDNEAHLAIVWTGGASSTGTGEYWATFKNISLTGTRYNRSGTHLLTEADYPTPSVIKGHQVFEDLLGRGVLHQFDGAGATIDTSTAQTIDQLAYPDGVTAERILEDVMALDEGFYWAAWEKNDTTGKYRCEWAKWPTTPTLEADVADGFTAPGSAADLYNSVFVRWRDPIGRIRSTVRTQTVPELTAAGLTRVGFVDLGDEVGSELNATRAGDQFLTEHAAPPNAGTLTVARPIMHLATGRYLAPWELPRHAPGKLIRVRGVLPRVDALNTTTGRDGVTTFRVIAAEFRASDAAAVLELDAYPVTTARALRLYGSRLPPDLSRRRR